MTGTVEEMLNDMKHGVYDKTDNGRCVGCGECCSNALPMRQKEIKIIQRYIKEHGIKEQKAPAVFAKQPFDMTCPFMRKDVSKDRCTIYPVRPEICRDFKCDKARHNDWFHGSMDGFMLIDVRATFFGGDADGGV
jgi:Fe-S-cluster containining protein